MTMGKLIKIVDKVYPDGLVGLYYKHPTEDHGDLLAKFIARELSETYDPRASELDQLVEANRVMNRAAMELDAVCAALDAAAHKCK